MGGKQAKEQGLCAFTTIGCENSICQSVGVYGRAELYMSSVTIQSVGLSGKQWSRFVENWVFPLKDMWILQTKMDPMRLK